MTGTFLQLSMDLDKWTGKIEAFYRDNRELEVIWNESRTQLTPLNTFIPFGADALLRQLQHSSFFQHSMSVQGLDIASLEPGRGLTTVGELKEFLQENAKASPLTDAVVKGINNWLDEEIEFAAGTLLSGMWNNVMNNNAIPFATFGAEKLVTVFKDEEEFFTHCGRAQALKSVIFANGSIKTVGEFHDHLTPCS
jgi:hypothetical protein